MDGYAEIIKTACISRSDDLFKKLESGNFDIQEIIDNCVAVKTYYVEKDENDSGIRHMALSSPILAKKCSVSKQILKKKCSQGEW